MLNFTKIVLAVPFLTLTAGCASQLPTTTVASIPSTVAVSNLLVTDTNSPVISAVLNSDGITVETADGSKHTFPEDEICGKANGEVGGNEFDITGSGGGFGTRIDGVYVHRLSCPTQGSDSPSNVFSGLQDTNNDGVVVRDNGTPIVSGGQVVLQPREIAPAADEDLETDPDPIRTPVVIPVNVTPVVVTPPQPDRTPVGEEEEETPPAFSPESS